jgi:hypothetical protein
MGISELPDKNRVESQRKHTDGNAQRSINAGSVQDPKQPDNGPCTDHQQHDRPALKDPDTWPALSRIVVRMHLERHRLVNRSKLQIGWGPPAMNIAWAMTQARPQYGSNNQGGFNPSHLPVAERRKTRTDHAAEDGHQTEGIDNAGRHPQRLSQPCGRQEWIPCHGP